MQSFSIWHWIVVTFLIVLAVGAVALFVRALNSRRPQASGSREVSGPSGFGGWLALLAIGVFVSPLITIVKLSKVEGGVDGAFIHEFQLMFNTDIGIHLAVIAMQLCTAVVMVLKSRRFVPLYVVTGICMILLVPVEISWICAVLYWQEGIRLQKSVAGEVTPDVIQQWISTTIGVGIWILYVIRSRRVANTFVR